MEVQDDDEEDLDVVSDFGVCYFTLKVLVNKECDSTCQLTAMDLLRFHLSFGSNFAAHERTSAIVGNQEEERSKADGASGMATNNKGKAIMGPSQNRHGG